MSTSEELGKILKESLNSGESLGVLNDILLENNITIDNLNDIIKRLKKVNYLTQNPIKTTDEKGIIKYKVNNKLHRNIAPSYIDKDKKILKFHNFGKIGGDIKNTVYELAYINYDYSKENILLEYSGNTYYTARKVGVLINKKSDATRFISNYDYAYTYEAFSPHQFGSESKKVKQEFLSIAVQQCKEFKKYLDEE